MAKNINSKGFTIVELLIVIVVIGILAALVITTFSGIQQKGRDTERQTDVRALHSMLEAFYAQNGGGYPSRTDFNTVAFRTANMKGLDPTAMCDPSAASAPTCDVAAAPAANVYAYQTWEADGATTCVNADTAGAVCAKYTLTATTEQQINGAYIYVKNSLN